MVDEDAVRRVARLARISISDAEIEQTKIELDKMLVFVAALAEVDTAGVEPMTSVVAMPMAMRQDAVTDGGIASQIVSNAPEREGTFFAVPRVIE